MTIVLPCELSPPLNGRPHPAVVATARHPARTLGLQVLLEGSLLDVRVGQSRVATVPWPRGCPLTIAVRDGELRLPGRSFHLATPGLGDMPIVTGLFTNLDLRKGDAPRVAVRSRDYTTSSSVPQLVATGVALAAWCFALFLLFWRETTGARTRLRRRVASAWRARHPADALVVVVLLAWCLIAPAYSDDAWFWAEQHEFASLGAVSFYFDHWAVISPLGYWLEWLTHGIVGSTHHVVLMRAPTLAVLLAAWLVCRACIGRVLPDRPKSGTHWILASAFLVGAVAWGMTLRPEPFVAFLTLVELTAMVSSARSPRLSAFLVALLAAALALTAHPTGVVALAPLLASLPYTVQWIRRSDGIRRLEVATAGLVAVASALVLFTFDSDLAHRLRDSRVVRTSDLHNGSPWTEYIRYENLDPWGGGTTLRRLSVGLMFLCVVAVLTRRRSIRTNVLELPAHTVGFGLLLLAFVPSKWPWHFGSLIGVAAVAEAAELERLFHERSRADAALRGVLRSALAPGLIAAVALFAWGAPGTSVSPFDLQSLRWQDGFNRSTWIVFAVLLPAAGVLVRLAIDRRRGGGAHVVSRSILTWAVCGASFAAVAITLLLPVLDATRVPWSSLRQNLGSLSGRSGCGLADELRGDPALAAQLSQPGTATLLHPPIGLYFPCAEIPGTANGLISIPNYVILRSVDWPLFLQRSPFAATIDLYRLEPLARGPNYLFAYEVEDGERGYARTVVRSELGGRAP